MSDYSDKSFKELYSEVIEYVKTLTTKWDPTVSDEADPGVVILKAACLLFDKINYRINYRNSQNSVRDVTDPVEGEKLFYDLGYQLRDKRSATGNISLRYLSSGGTDPVTIPLFTQFQDKNNSITFTSIRREVSITPGSSVLIEVQEGVPVRYEYLGRKIFTDEDLTSNLKLYLYGYSDISSNGVILTPGEVDGNGVEITPTMSNWLNVGDNIFTAVETSNLYSVGRDSSGVSYIQFYEESLASLKKGIQVWVLSSAGAAGNIRVNKLSKLSSTSSTEIDSSKFVISHPEFKNGQNRESLSEARDHYYQSFGVNNSLVSARDYTQTLESILGPNLVRIISKSLVSDVSGYHNTVEVLTKDEAKTYSLFVNYLSTLTPGVFIDALKYSDDYLESFTQLSDNNTFNLIKKAIFQRNVVSNDVKKAGGLYSKFLFDLAEVQCTLIIDSNKLESEIIDEVKTVLKEKFNSRNLTLGKMVSEIELAEAVKNNIKGVISCSFSYKNHTLVKNLVKDVSGNYTTLTGDEKIDLVARSVLRGDLPLFKDKKLHLPPIRSAPSSVREVYKVSPNGAETPVSRVDLSDLKVNKISGLYNFTSSASASNKRLGDSEFIQFYKISEMDSQTYGYGVKAVLLTDQWSLGSDLSVTSDNCILVKNSVIKSGSVLVSDDTKNYAAGITGFGDGVVIKGLDQSLIGSDSTSDKPFYRSGSSIVCKTDYQVKTALGLSSGTVLKTGSVIYDGSHIYGGFHHQIELKDGETLNLIKYPEAQLRLKTGDNSTDVVVLNSESDPSTFKISNFSDGLKSSGDLAHFEGWGNIKNFTSETLTTLVKDETELVLSGNYKYAFICNFDFTDYNKTEYILGEGEHFIYSDSDLLDFIDFGSGTLLKVESSDDFKGLVTSGVTLDLPLGPQLIDLEKEVTLCNTEISTFSGENYTVFYDEELSLTNDWRDLDSDEKITIEDESSKTRIIFDSSYKCRIGLILKSSDDGYVKIKGEQSLIIYGTDGSDNYKIKEVFNSESYLAVSENLYINSASSQDLSEFGLKLDLFSIPGLDPEHYYTLGVDFTDKGLTYKFSKNNGYNSARGLTELTFSPGKYLLSLSSESGTLKFGSSLPGGWESLYTEVGAGSTLENYGEFLIYVNTINNSSLKIYGGSDTDTLTLKVLKYPEDFNDDLFSSSSNNSEKFENSGTNGSDILAKIKTLSSGLKFSYEFVNSQQVRKPTEVLSYYDPQHILNKNILTVLDIDKLDQSTVKVIKRF